MSSERARYEIAAAERARREEEARRRAQLREWATQQVVRAQQRERAGRIQRRYGLDVPVVNALGAAEGADSAALARSVAAATRATSEIARRLDAIERAGQENEVAERLTAIIGAPTAGELADSRTGSRVAPDRATDAARERAIEEAARVVARLDPAADRIADRDERTAAVAAARTPELRTRLLDELRADVRDRNAAAARRRADAAALAFLRTAAEQTADSELTRLVELADTELAAARPVEVSRLRVLAEDALARHDKEERRRLAEQAVLAAFAELDYTVLDGFTTAVPGGGLLLRRETGSPDAVGLEVDADRIVITPVRLTPDGRDVPRDRDAERRAEQRVCTDAQRVWDRLHAHPGLDVARQVTKVDGLVPRQVPVDATLLDDPARQAADDDVYVAPVAPIERGL